MRSILIALCGFVIGITGLSAQVDADAHGEEDAAVYQTIARFLATHGDPESGPLLVASVTAPGWTSASGRSSLAFLLRADSVNAGLVAAFLRRNAGPVTLRSDWDRPNTVHWLDQSSLPSDATDSAYAAGWSRVHERYPDATEIIQWSKAAFTAAGDSALVIQESLERPPYGKAGCRANVYTYWLAKVKGEWQVNTIGHAFHYSRSVETGNDS